MPADVTHDFPRMFYLWGADVDSRWDMAAVHILPDRVTKMIAARAANPTMVILGSHEQTNGICAVTYGGQFNLWGGGTDSVVDGAAGSAGFVRAFDNNWDFIYNADGTQAIIPGGGPGWNLANTPYNRGGLTSTPDTLGRYLLLKLKANRLYRDGWDGYFSDNWIYSLRANWFFGPNVDTDRNHVVDNPTTATLNFGDGLNAVGKYLRDNLPGLNVGGNGVYKADALANGEGPTLTDPTGWQKGANFSMMEDGAAYLFSDANAQKVIDIANRHLTFADPYGRHRYFIFEYELCDDSGVHLARPANYNTPAVYLQPVYYRQIRKGLGLACCAGAYYNPIFYQQHDARLFCPDEMRGGTLSARGWMGQPLTGAPTHPTTGVYMREFQRGLAIVNVLGGTQTVSLPGGANVWKRIQGADNPFNDGSTVATSTISVPANDAIFLVRIGVAPPVTGDPPANNVLPTLTGLAQTGSTLTSAPGSWTGAPSSYTMTFVRYEADGVTRRAVLSPGYVVPVGGPYPTYQLSGPTAGDPTGDVGFTVRLEVTAVNSFGTSSTAISAATPVIVASGGTGTGSSERYDGPASVIFDFLAQVGSVVYPPTGTFDFTIPPPAGNPPVNQVLPVASGGTAQGATETVTPGTWTGDPLIVFAYQWQRDNNGGGSFTSIAGATAASYTTGAADVGCNVRCAVTGQNGVGGATVNSNQLGPIQAPAAPVVPGATFGSRSLRYVARKHLRIWPPAE